MPRIASPDAPMLINCVAYDHGSKLADLDVRDISDYLQQPDCSVWVALRDPTNEDIEDTQSEFGLHDLAVEDARNGHQRPKVEEHEQTLFVVTVEHAVAPLLEAVGKLWSGRVPAACKKNRAYLRDVYDHLSRINAPPGTLRETITTAIQVNLSGATIEESETTKRLAGRHGRRRHDVRRHLGHELQAHARARVGVRQSRGDRRDRRGLRAAVLALPQGWLALSGSPHHFPAR